MGCYGNAYGGFIGVAATLVSIEEWNRFEDKIEQITITPYNKRKNKQREFIPIREAAPNKDKHRASCMKAKLKRKRKHK